MTHQIEKSEPSSGLHPTEGFFNDDMLNEEEDQSGKQAQVYDYDEKNDPGQEIVQNITKEM